MKKRDAEITELKASRTAQQAELLAMRRQVERLATVEARYPLRPSAFLPSPTSFSLHPGYASEDRIGRSVMVPAAFSFNDQRQSHWGRTRSRTQRRSRRVPQNPTPRAAVRLP